MKILFLIDTLEIGGAEKSLLEIARHCHQVEPLMCHIYPGQTLKPAYQQAGVPVISLDVPGKYSFGAAVRRLTEVAQKEQVGLVHTSLFRADIVGRTAGKLAGIPVVSSFVNESYHPGRWQSISLTERLKLRVVQEMDRITARWACHFMAVSESTKAANCRALSLPFSKVTVICRGRDPRPFLSVSSEQVDDLRRNLHLADGAPVLLNVARLLQRKGQAELIQAMPVVLNAFPTARLLIAGEGPDQPDLEALIQNLGLKPAVHLLGTRPDIPQLLHLADLFVFPSHYEGYPGALIEAMFTARPIVASDIPVHRETIIDGTSGLLPPVNDSGALAERIIWMLAHPCEAKAMGRQLQEMALQRFHIDHVAAQHEQMYASLLARLNPDHKSPTSKTPL